jgi:hypothetical protein
VPSESDVPSPPSCHRRAAGRRRPRTASLEWPKRSCTKSRGGPARHSIGLTQEGRAGRRRARRRGSGSRRGAPPPEIRRAGEVIQDHVGPRSRGSSPHRSAARGSVAGNEGVDGRVSCRTTPKSWSSPIEWQSWYGPRLAVGTRSEGAGLSAATTRASDRVRARETAVVDDGNLVPAGARGLLDLPMRSGFSLWAGSFDGCRPSSARSRRRPLAAARIAALARSRPSGSRARRGNRRTCRSSRG